MYSQAGRRGNSIADDTSRQDALYEHAANDFGAALGRLARAYEPDEEKRRGLLQEIHVALWRSFAGFNGDCSVATCVYRVAHNVATSQVQRERKRRQQMASLEELENLPSADDHESATGQQQMMDRMLGMIRRLKPVDRQVILSYREGADAATIAEVTRLSAANVATKIHRIKNILSHRLREGERDAE